jgi:hypothetical protein
MVRAVIVVAEHLDIYIAGGRYTVFKERGKPLYA